MKRRKGRSRLLSCALLCLTAALLFTGCAGGTESAETSARTTETAEPGGERALVLTKDGKTDYRIIYPADADAETQEAAENLRSILGTYCGAEPEILSDSAEAAACEILIGRTNRAASERLCEGMGYADWAIEAAGESVALAASTGKGASDAVSYFLRSTLGVFSGLDAKAPVTIPRDYRYRPEISYPLDGITVGARDIAVYTIVISRDASDVEQALAETVRAAVGNACGAVLRIVNDRRAETDCEIIIGKTTRKKSASYYAVAPDVSEFSYHLTGEALILVVGGDRACTAMGAHSEQELKQAKETYNMATLDG